MTAREPSSTLPLDEKGVYNPYSSRLAIDYDCPETPAPERSRPGFDPTAMEQAQQLLPDVDYRSDPYHAAQESDALVLLTEWNELRNLDLDRIKELMRRLLFLDLRRASIKTRS